MHEHRLIADVAGRLTTPDDMLGIGDDCCIWTPSGPTCLSTDSIVEGVHFGDGTAPEAVGRKAAAAAVSDLAGMGAVPVGAVVAIHGNNDWDMAAILGSCAEELERHGCALLGGDTTAARQLVVNVTVWGEAVADGRLLRRDGASAGNLLVVTGRLGGSLASDRHLRPEPRLAAGQWFARQPAVTALMDLSDGLATDARRLAAASGCGALLLPEQVPVHDDALDAEDPIRAACCDGEDYELLAAIEPAAWPTLQTAWPDDGLPLGVVGWLVPEAGLWHEDAMGQVAPLDWTGYEHR